MDLGHSFLQILVRYKENQPNVVSSAIVFGAVGDCWSDCIKNLSYILLFP